MSTRLILAALLAVSAPTAATAQAVADKPAVVLDPTKAYVMYTTYKGGQAVELIREPNADDIARYKEARDKALAKARRKYAGKLKTWQTQSDPKTATPGAPTGPKPVEPTDATFTFHPIELDTMVAMGPFNRFSKAGEQSVYLQEVVPGTYTLYGPIVTVPNGASAGTCLCMGTVQFKVEAGAIVDMGFMAGGLVEANRKAKEAGAPAIRDPLELPEGTTSFAIDQKREGMIRDPRIGSYPVRAAVYRPAGKRSNWHGVAVDRLTEMPGIFRYERDKQIDLTGGAG